MPARERVSGAASDHAAEARAARAAGEPCTRRAGRGAIGCQLPAIVSTGLNAPRSTL